MANLTVREIAVADNGVSQLAQEAVTERVNPRTHSQRKDTADLQDENEDVVSIYHVLFTFSLDNNHDFSRAILDGHVPSILRVPWRGRTPLLFLELHLAQEWLLRS